MTAGANVPLPVDTAPMEAKLADEIPSDGMEWQYEPKWDGFRFLAFKSGAAVDIRAKSGKPLGRYFPELVEVLADLDGAQFVVDGEIVIEVGGRYSFDALQMRLHPAESRIRKLALQTPAKMILFDSWLMPMAGMSEALLSSDTSSDLHMSAEPHVNPVTHFKPDREASAPPYSVWLYPC